MWCIVVTNRVTNRGGYPNLHGCVLMLIVILILAKHSCPLSIQGEGPQWRLLVDKAINEFVTSPISPNITQVMDVNLSSTGLPRWSALPFPHHDWGWNPWNPSREKRWCLRDGIHDRFMTGLPRFISYDHGMGLHQKLGEIRWEAQSHCSLRNTPLETREPLEKGQQI